MYDPLTTVESVEVWLQDQSGNNVPSYKALIPPVSQLIGKYLGRDNLGAVNTYTENYTQRRGRVGSCAPAPIVLRHYPVVSLSSVTLYGLSVPIINPATLSAPSSATGVLLEDDARTLSFYSVSWPWPTFTGSGLPICQVSYTAGLTPYDQGLQQVANQWVGEIFKSQAWIGHKSKSLAGEVVSFDMGVNLGMSPRTLAMLQPYRNVVPTFGVA